MKIELTNDQYRTLVELLFLGDWLANATRTGAKGDELIGKYRDIQQVIYQYAKEFKSDDIILNEHGSYFTTLKFEEDLMPLVEDYDSFTFFEQLPINLAERDWRREIGPVRKITERHLERREELIALYEEEIHKNGLKNIIVNLQ